MYEEEKAWAMEEARRREEIEQEHAWIEIVYELECIIERDLCPKCINRLSILLVSRNSIRHCLSMPNSLEVMCRNFKEIK